MNRRAAFIYAAFLSFSAADFVSSGWADQTAKHAGKPSIVVSVEPFAYIVEKLAPNIFETVVMLPAGANHDTYEPTIAQLKNVSRAKLFVKVGHPSFIFETAWLDRIIAENPTAQVVNAGEGVELLEGDPHIWLSPRAVLQIAANIAAGLSAVEPSARRTIARNKARLENEIREVDARIRQILSGKTGREFLVYHSAWQYFANEYAIKELAIEREGKEPDAAQVADIIREAKQQQIKTLLIEPQFSRAGAQTIAEELNAEVKVIDHMRRDWSNNLISTAQVIAEALGR